MRHKLRAFRALSQRDRWTLLQAWITLLAVDLALRTLPFRAATQLRGRAAPPRGSPRFAALGARRREEGPVYPDPKSDQEPK